MEAIAQALGAESEISVSVGISGGKDHMLAGHVVSTANGVLELRRKTDGRHFFVPLYRVVFWTREIAPTPPQYQGGLQ